MGWRVVVPLLVVSLLLAGCTANDELEPDGNEGDANTAGGGSSDDAVDPGAAPARWELGRAWTYSTNFGDDITFVVTGNQSGDWIVDTTSEQTAWFHARSEISYLGAIRQTDLAGSQGDDRVRYFDFPLRQGKTWTTPWDGVERRVETVEAGNGSYLFEAYEEDRLVFEYSYDPQSGWFGSLTFHMNTTRFTMELESHQEGWSGEVVRWTAEERFTTDSGGLVFTGTSFTVEEGTQEIWARFWMTCPQQQAESVIVLALTPAPPSDQTIFLEAECMDEEDFLVIEEPEPTEWHVWALVMAPLIEEESRLEFEVWTRTLERIPVG